MEPGSASPVIPVKSGFVILKLEDIRYPENPKEKERAKEEARKHKKVEVLKDYNKGLVKKYAKIHKEVIEGIDYESKEPGFQQLLKDTRVIAEIKGEKPITVGELSQEFRQQFYHGVDRAIEGKKLNSKKIPALEDMVYKRVFRKEALRLGLDKSENYKDKVKGYENSVIFGAFMQKAVIPGIKLTEDEVTKYYHEHIGEYTFPEMMRIRSLIFFKRSDAEGAIEKLRKGTDFQWLLAHSEGQVDKNMKDLLRFEGNILVIKDLPDGMRKVISGAKSGNSRLYAGPEGYFYVLSVQEAFPSKAKSYPEAKEEIAKKVFDNKVNKAVEDWVDKLRAVAEIKIYLKNNN
jgi:hypothetical protein